MGGGGGCVRGADRAVGVPGRKSCRRSIGGAAGARRSPGGPGTRWRRKARRSTGRASRPVSAPAAVLPLLLAPRDERAHLTARAHTHAGTRHDDAAHEARQRRSRGPSGSDRARLLCVRPIERRGGAQLRLPLAALLGAHELYSLLYRGARARCTGGRRCSHAPRAPHHARAPTPPGRGGGPHERIVRTRAPHANRASPAPTEIARRKSAVPALSIRAPPFPRHRETEDGERPCRKMLPPLVSSTTTTPRPREKWRSRGTARRIALARRPSMRASRVRQDAN